MAGISRVDQLTDKVICTPAKIEDLDDFQLKKILWNDVNPRPPLIQSTGLLSTTTELLSDWSYMQDVAFVNSESRRVAIV